MNLRLDPFSKGRPYFANLVVTREGYPEHGQDFHEVMHVVSGSGVHVINGVGHELRATQSWHITPRDCHSIESGESGLSWINIAFPVEPMMRFLELTRLTTSTGLLATASRTPFDRALRRQYSDHANWELASFLIEVFAPPKPFESGPVWLKEAIGALADDGLQRGVAAMVEKASVSPSHLSRTVRSEYGITPTELVNRHRLERAAFLLATSSASASQICLECGFESLSYFYRLFRGKFGVTPLDYRKRIRAVPGFIAQG